MATDAKSVVIICECGAEILFEPTLEEIEVETFIAPIINIDKNIEDRKHDHISKAIRIGNFIKQGRKTMRFSQEDLAQNSGIPLSIIQCLEDQTFGLFVPKPEVLVKLEKGLGLPGILFEA